MTPIEITKDNFESEVLNAMTPVLADFYASWCGPCHAIAPIVEDLAETYAGRIKVVKINTDENLELAKKYKMSSIPTLLLFENGSVIRLIGVGLRAKADLIKGLDSYLQQALVR